MNIEAMRKRSDESGDCCGGYGWISQSEVASGIDVDGVEQCVRCRIYDTDLDAASALARHIGASYVIRCVDGNGQPLRLPSALAAIYVRHSVANAGSLQQELLGLSEDADGSPTVVVLVEQVETRLEVLGIDENDAMLDEFANRFTELDRILEGQ